MTSTDVSSFWIASDRTSQGQIEEEEEEEEKKTWGWEEGPFTSRSSQKGPPFIIWT